MPGPKHPAGTMLGAPRTSSLPSGGVHLMYTCSLTPLPLCPPLPPASLPETLRSKAQATARLTLALSALDGVALSTLDVFRYCSV